MEGNKISAYKIALITLLNGILATVISAAVGYYFSSKSMRDEQMISFRRSSIKKIEPTIEKAKHLIKEIEIRERAISPQDYQAHPGGGMTMSAGKSVLSGEMITLSNELNELVFNLPYQHRIIILAAKALFFEKNWNKAVKDHKLTSTKNIQNLTANSFVLALDIATEEFILNGEPRHEDLSPLFR